jgi:hypothetical protein
MKAIPIASWLRESRFRLNLLLARIIGVILGCGNLAVKKFLSEPIEN